MDWLRSEDLKEVKVGTAPCSEYNSCGVEVVRSFGILCSDDAGGTADAGLVLTPSRVETHRRGDAGWRADGIFEGLEPLFREFDVRADAQIPAVAAAPR